MNVFVGVLFSLAVLMAVKTSSFQISTVQSYDRRPAVSEKSVQYPAREFLCLRLSECVADSKQFGLEVSKVLKAQWPSRILGPVMLFVATSDGFAVTLSCWISPTTPELADGELEILALAVTSKDQDQAVRTVRIMLAPESALESIRESLPEARLPVGFFRQNTVLVDGTNYSVGVDFVVSPKPKK